MHRISVNFVAILCFIFLLPFWERSYVRRSVSMEIKLARQGRYLLGARVVWLIYTRQEGIR